MASRTIAVVADTDLGPSDIAQITGLYGSGVTVQLLVPATDTEPRLRAAMDHLALGEVSDAWATLRGHDPDAPSLQRAAIILRESLAELRALGLKADGEVIPGDPIAALVQTIASTKATAAVFITRPHLVGDALHEDWSSKARRALGVPVIHFYSGTTKLLS
ncbi:MAG: hypothetical protein LBG11_06100 [Bifidobacteriaceae bacterium]|jgi:hypothetical protein|nr:hypothetical protein [Bifidobacteriaceae bacterium]